MLFYAKIRPLEHHGIPGSPGGIVGFRAVVIHEDGVIATITKDGAAEFSFIA
jgi:hypothetical protein